MHNRELFARLRASYGALPWLTIVSGVTATACRLAGMTGEELHALLGSEGGLINIQTRRKPLMRLRAGFDGSTGAIKDENGFVTMFFSFGLGRYWDLEATINGPLRPGDTTLAPGVPPCRVDAITPTAPPCLAGVKALMIDRPRWGAIIHVASAWETLARMPAEVADELGLERQRYLGHIPWLNYNGPIPAEHA